MIKRFQNSTTIQAALCLAMMTFAPQAMHAAAPNILSAGINAQANQLIIVGSGFTTGGNPVVKMDGIQLTVITQTNTYLVATLPQRLMNATYQVTVSNGTVAKFSVSTDFRFGINTSSAIAGSGATCTLGQAILSAGPVTVGIPAQGQLLQITASSALYDLIGTTYGGDGVSTFALPDLRAAAPTGLTYSICDQGVFPSGR